MGRIPGNTDRWECKADLPRISSYRRIYLVEASRDKTDDFIVANDGDRRTVSLTGLGLAAEFDPLRSNSNQLALELPQVHRGRGYAVDIVRDDVFATAAVSKV